MPELAIIAATVCFAVPVAAIIHALADGWRRRR